MSSRINEESYAKLIQENIDWLEKLHPEKSVIKTHIIDVLNQSIINEYSEAEEPEDRFKNECNCMYMTNGEAEHSKNCPQYTCKCN